MEKEDEAIPTKVHQYDTEAEAKAAIEACNRHYGIPVPGGLTKSWTDYKALEGKFIIRSEQSVKTVLGDPITINIK